MLLEKAIYEILINLRNIIFANSTIQAIVDVAINVEISCVLACMQKILNNTILFQNLSKFIESTKFFELSRLIDKASDLSR